jgi:phospholipase/carboxylesterase
MRANEQKESGMMLDGPRWGPREGRAEQLVVLCHGVGADGHDLIDLAPGWAQALPHAAFVAPDAPEAYDMAPVGRQWFSLADRAPARLAAGVAVAAESLESFVESECLRLGVGRDSVALMGFSQGAMTALHAGLRMAAPPRAILAYSGRLIAPAVATSAAVLLVHGADDEVVPVTGSREAEAALLAAGVAVEAVYCPGLGHGIDSAGIAFGALFLQRAFDAG